MCDFRFLFVVIPLVMACTDGKSSDTSDDWENGQASSVDGDTDADDATAMDASQQILFPESPVLVVGLVDAVWLDPTGEIEELSHQDTVQRISVGAAPIVCHAPSCARRLNIEQFRALDVLELFAFVRPTNFCSPTAEGLARAMDLDAQPGAVSNAIMALTGKRLSHMPFTPERVLAALKA